MLPNTEYVEKTQQYTPPHPAQQLIDRWLSSSVGRHLSAHRVLPAQPARARAFPPWLHPRLAAGLRAMGIESLYQHQWEAAEAAAEGLNLVIATPTASGKTLCYNLPVLQRLLSDPSARAIYLFPTKALARDQVEQARALAAAVGEEVGIAVYDGDTPAEHRRAARRKARIIATNPEMLHSGILPHHPAWAELMAGLCYVIVDELHTYRGVFGGHLAHVLRRLDRVARFHGASPQLIATSATIANPLELAERLFGRPAHLIEENGAPQGERHFLIYNPPMIDAAIGLRESYLRAACRLTRELAAASLGTLVFCRSRLAMEVTLRHLRDLIEGGGREERELDATSKIRGYRGGYLPDRRREVERALRQGETEVVVATSALELGIDIGALDAVVVAGWPGSRAGVWQRAGRAGRRLAPSLTVLVTSSEPVDQFVAADPDYLFGQAAEHARIDPYNASILVPQMKCASFELPFAPREPYGELDAGETGEVLGCLSQAGLLHHSEAGYHYVGDAYPAGEVSLRGRLAENYVVIRQPAGEVIAEVDHHDAPEVLFPGAIYQLEGDQYQVLELDHDNCKAYVSAVSVDYFTDAITQTRIRILETAQRAGSAAQGEIHVLHRVAGFKKIKLHTGENLGYGEVGLPDREMHTTALWLDVPAEGVSALGVAAAEIAEASLGLSQALHSVASLVLMSDSRDLGRAVGDARASWFAAGSGSTRPRYSVPDGAAELPALLAPTLFLYDEYAGGTGLSERLFDLRAELIRRTRRALERCTCERGCPACIGPGATVGAKPLALALLRLLESGGGA